MLYLILNNPPALANMFWNRSRWHGVLGTDGIAGVWGVCFGRPSQGYDIYVKTARSDINNSLFVIGVQAGYVYSHIFLFTNDL